MRLRIAQWLLLQAFNIVGQTEQETKLAKKIWLIRKELQSLQTRGSHGG